MATNAKDVLSQTAKELREIEKALSNGNLERDQLVKRLQRIERDLWEHLDSMPQGLKVGVRRVLEDPMGLRGLQGLLSHAKELDVDKRDEESFGEYRRGLMKLAVDLDNFARIA